MLHYWLYMNNQNIPCILCYLLFFLYCYCTYIYDVLNDKIRILLKYYCPLPYIKMPSETVHHSFNPHGNENDMTVTHKHKVCYLKIYFQHSCIKNYTPISESFPIGLTLSNITIMDIDEINIFNYDNHAIIYVGHTVGLTLTKNNTVSINDIGLSNEYYHVEINISLYYYYVSAIDYLIKCHYNDNEEFGYVLMCNKNIQDCQWINKSSILCLIIAFI